MQKTIFSTKTSVTSGQKQKKNLSESKKKKRYDVNVYFNKKKTI